MSTLHAAQVRDGVGWLARSYPAAPARRRPARRAPSMTAAAGAGAGSRHHPAGTDARVHRHNTGHGGGEGAHGSMTLQAAVMPHNSEAHDASLSTASWL